MEGRVPARAVAALRIILGWGFLYAGLDKVIHFDGSGKAFDAGGFLRFATAGTAPGAAEKAIVNPTHDLWVSLGANAGLVSLINVLVVFGEIAIGVALILGLATRFAGIMGTLMMGLFFIASWDFAHGIVNEQLLYGGLAAFLAASHAGETFGLDGILKRTTFVRAKPLVAALM